MVIPPNAAARIRAGGSSGGVAVHIEFSGPVNVGGGRAGAAEFMDELETQIRSGRLGYVIRERVRR
jgi:hypothetical protein